MQMTFMQYQKAMSNSNVDSGAARTKRHVGGVFLSAPPLSVREFLHDSDKAFFTAHGDDLSHIEVFVGSSYPLSPLIFPSLKS
jgi:hypothetical protein